ncbi:matrix Gla protein [Ambystoma mexicanum]|uniref:matrix Gla protein n=1 Tax=Ambystoma mexicanum TaxID=8296 RepID=UPI0037E89FCB
MHTLVIFALVITLATVTLSYDSQESNESFERYSPFVSPRRANTFMTYQQRRNARVNERIREQTKSPQERQREICDDYDLCERYAMRHGFPAAYRRYFGNRRTK